MNLASLSIKRPIFITCVVIVMLAVGYLSLRKLPVDLFPNVTFPYVRVITTYPGAGPAEVETLVSKVIEDEASTIPGLKTLSSTNREGVSIVFAEFTLETNVQYAEQQVRDRVASARRKLPQDIDEPLIRKLDPADQPILILSLHADLPEGALYDLADQVIRPKIEQINQVGLVEVSGGRKREIQVLLDRGKLKRHELSATAVSNRIAATGQNIPAGKVNEDAKETSFRTMGEFKKISEIGSTIVSFLGSDVPVTVSDVGTVIDTLEDETSRTYHNGKKSLLLQVYRQSGANTVAVTDAVKARVAKLNDEIKNDAGKPSIVSVRDGAKPIRANLDDVRESIFIGIALTILVVFFFLGSWRSTLITGLALPNSLLGAFILMASSDFSINVMTLLALSLTVGLLIDDAIVVRENIFRHIEMGKKPVDAALDGTKEVTLAVIATTLTVIAVFGPIAFLQGVVGKFFKEFGLTICFAMLISLFDALTMAPMLSAYFAGSLGHGGEGAHRARKPGFMGTLRSGAETLYHWTLGRAVRAFDRFQTALENGYVKLMRFTIRHPLITLSAALGIFVASILATAGVPKTFLPAQDVGEFSVVLETPPGTSLERMTQLSLEVDQMIRKHPEVQDSVLISGSTQTGPTTATFFVLMVPPAQRQVNTTVFKDRIRDDLKKYADLKPRVTDIDMIGGGMRPFNLNIMGSDLNQIEQIAQKAFEILQRNPALKDPEISYRPGKPELQVSIDNRRAEQLGISSAGVGMELRTLVEGSTPTVFRESGREYNVRVRLQEDQRNLRDAFGVTFVPNVNNNLIRLPDFAKPLNTAAPAEISRQDRGRYVRIGADITPGGPGMGKAMEDIRQMFAPGGAVELPPGVRYRFVGQAENFVELVQSMGVAMGLGILFIFMVLASLYESFIIPLAIMLVLPLAASGAFFALLITRQSLDLFSMIGCVMLMGIATKNSILLVDYTHQKVLEGMDRAEAILEAGRHRLRPILMTTVALIAGMTPVAIGLNEASKQRTSMGVAIIGGLVSSTLLTLVVVPAAYSYIDRFRVWSQSALKRLLAP